MNSKLNTSRRSTLNRSFARLAFCVLLGGTTAISLADRGGGSIRGSDRPAPPPRAPEPRHDDRPAPPPDQGRPQPDRPQPDHPGPDRPEPPHPGPDHAPPPPDHGRGDWDDHDEDPGHWGGYGHGTPPHFAWGQRFHDLPHHIVVFFNNVNFYFGDDGACYQQQPDGEYLCVQPPVGCVVPALADGAITLSFGDGTYYYIDGVYLVAQDNGYAVINPPFGIVVPVLPSAATQLVFKGVVFYQFNGYNYTPSIQDGVTVYTVTPIS
jgi:hypothetical protein